MSSTRSRRGAAGQPVPGAEEVARADSQITSCTPAGLPASARVLFAVVSADGTLVRGLGATSVTRLAAGMYQVVFDQDVTHAGYVGTVGPAAGGKLAPQGAVAVAPRTGIPNAVFVETYGGGEHVDRPFHLAVLA
ncbi:MULTISPECIES: hypothetical protein [Micromonospora]|uniref:Uncharacterized protein n=1 Tax=Micromonospora solifontis TaxID=2487138 RepID=A0ABX9WGE7_9ACTN|nr:MULTISPECIES: hypothetical protein [Micromonospora]NES15158.1 hypothetical protein [Micromonospora sp. PPF5-17B]NES36835.1 hypothetical protein [Micromonospora solifontis]NES56493.1 hypothetical protein [Micromonospora sp. PPF5-6]RNL99025.1 hypothetical protein EFE23_11810 [Micromonospora solifontis]